MAPAEDATTLRLMCAQTFAAAEFKKSIIGEESFKLRFISEGYQERLGREDERNNAFFVDHFAFPLQHFEV